MKLFLETTTEKLSLHFNSHDLNLIWKCLLLYSTSAIKHKIVAISGSWGLVKVVCAYSPVKEVFRDQVFSPLSQPTFRHLIKFDGFKNIKPLWNKLQQKVLVIETQFG